MCARRTEQFIAARAAAETGEKCLCHFLCVSLLIVGELLFLQQRESFKFLHLKQN